MNISVNTACRLADAEDTEQESVADPDLFTIYPNPASNHVLVQFSSEENEKITIRLIDMMGKTVYLEELPTVIGVNKKEINLENLPVGVYHLSLEKQGALFRKGKIVVEK